MKDNTKNILLGLLAVGLIGMTIAYAALSTTLTIGGTASVPEAKWDIHFENWTEAKPASLVSGITNTASTTTAPTMTPANKGTLINGLVVSLLQPGDSMAYTFDIVNDGTINAKLSSFLPSMTVVKTGTSTPATTTDDLDYSIVCGAEAAKPAQGAQTMTSPAEPTTTPTADTLTAGYSRACKLTISYKPQSTTGTAGDAQTYTGEARTVTLGANWVWVQN